MTNTFLCQQEGPGQLTVIFLLIGCLVQIIRGLQEATSYQARAFIDTLK